MVTPFDQSNEPGKKVPFRAADAFSCKTGEKMELSAVRKGPATRAMLARIGQASRLRLSIRSKSVRLTADPQQSGRKPAGGPS
jgi:hypothetical protein